MKLTPLAVMVCYTGVERQGWKKGKIREIEQHTHGTVLHTCTHLACPSHNYILCCPGNQQVYNNIYFFLIGVDRMYECKLVIQIVATP